MTVIVEVQLSLNYSHGLSLSSLSPQIEEQANDRPDHKMAAVVQTQQTSHLRRDNNVP